MSTTRCLDCGRLTNLGTRCLDCRRRRKGVRNAHAAELGPCPQDGICARCGEGPREGDPMTWDHLVPISQGGSTASARPSHKSCNSGARDR